MQVQFKQWNCKVNFAEYENGRTAILLTDNTTGEPIAKATVNIPEVEINQNAVIIKDCDENNGMFRALHKAGIITLPYDSVESGFNQYPVCQLLEAPK